MSNKILEPTINNGAIIGILQEKRLDLIRNTDGTITTIRGSFVIRVEHDEDFMDIEVPYYVNKLKKDGTENPMFDGAYTVYQEYKPATMGEKPDTVRCKVNVDINDYVNKRKEITSSLRLRCNSINREATDVEHEAKINIEGIIRGIDREIEDDQETGRLKVKLYGIKYGGALNPLDLIVPEELADSFESYYRVGDTVELVVKVVKTRVGKVEIKREATFGYVEESDAKVTSGYDVLEYHIIKGYPPIDDSEKILDPDDIQKAEKEREIMLQGLKTAANNKPTTSNGNPVSRNNPFLNENSTSRL